MIVFSELVLSTDWEHPAISAHQITLTLPNVASLTLKLPWPFLVDGIVSSLEKKKKKKWIHLVLKKSLCDPWPKEFGGRSKWDPDRLVKPWQDLPSNGSLQAHIEAQFDCDVLYFKFKYLELFQASGKPPISLPNITISPSKPPAVWVVREMVQSLFYGHHFDSFYLFAVHNHLNELVFHLRVQPPIRFTPQGSPLLLVSVIDHQCAGQLIMDGKLDAEENQFEFHRLITERVSREVCIIRTYSSEDLNIFRYLLRLNSTKMRRGAWTSKNLPRGENSPWLPTFISPLYAENISNKCCNLSTANQVSVTL